MKDEKQLQELIRVIYSCDRANGLSHDENMLSDFIYLSDWQHCLNHDEPLTNIQWIHGKQGPVAKNFDISEMTKAETTSGIKIIIEIINDFVKNKNKEYKYIDYEGRESVKEIFEKIKKLELNEVYLLANSTFPMICTAKESRLHLKELSKQYKRKFHKLEI